MNLEQAIQPYGLDYIAIDETTIQVAIAPLHHTNHEGGWMGRCGISQIPELVNGWCVVFEVANGVVDSHSEDILNSPVALYLGWLRQYCAEHFGGMEIVVQDNLTQTSRLSWAIEANRPVFPLIGIPQILTLSGSIFFTTQPDHLIAGVIPTIMGMVQQINQVVSPC